MNISNISVSRKQVFDLCTQKYKYQYHLKIPPSGPEPFFFIYGKIVHTIAEEYVRCNGDTRINEIATQVLTGKIPVEEKDGKPVYAPVLPTEYKKKLPIHLSAIYKITKTMGFGGFLEYEFKLPLDNEGRCVYGFIDRLLIKNDAAFIVDYKTSKVSTFRKNKGTIGDDLQLRTYGLVANKIFNISAEKIHAALYYLEDGKFVSTKFTNQMLEDAHAELLTTFKDIQNLKENEAWGNVGDWCRRCDFFKLCPFYKIH